GSVEFFRNPMKSSLQKLTEIYRELNETLPRSIGNPCGSCRECCTAGGVDRHSVTELELDLIAETHGPVVTDQFRRFASRERDLEGKHRWVLCPFYDEDARGCGIYDLRPFSCRVFGHFQVVGTDLPSVCTFRGKAKLVGGRENFVEVPLAGQLRDASRHYWPLRKGHPVRERPANETTAPNHPSLLSDLDSVDRAFLAQDRGDHETAAKELANDLQGSEHQPYLLFHLAQSLMALERYPEALERYEQALEQAPQSWELTYARAVALYQLERHQEAFRGFVQTIELNPEHALAWAFLGYMTLSDGLLKQSAVFFDNALNIDPENVVFRLRLGVILLKLECPAEARKLLEAVLAMPATETVHQGARAALSLIDCQF
ncbi:MAG: tetratricopeptide repeat protein, partial [Candidatus Eremiobacteraeota bacterium]|nr:tetratricopeptide repeat protein [Candidatus Eremiobacteraeota bacterium]